LRSADALRVRTGGTFDAPGAVHATLLEVHDRAEVQGLVRCIRVDWRQRPGGACQPGGPTLELSTGGARVATLAVIGDHDALRWAEDPGWASDLMLERASAQAVGDWLRAHGVSDAPPGR
jgi:hypothetical protein